MNEWINEKLLPPVLKFVNTKAITALRNGMLYTMPFTIVGSVFLLLANFQLQLFLNGLTQVVWLFISIKHMVHLLRLCRYLRSSYCLLVCKKRGI